MKYLRPIFQKFFTATEPYTGRAPGHQSHFSLQIHNQRRSLSIPETRSSTFTGRGRSFSWTAPFSLLGQSRGPTSVGPRPCLSERGGRQGNPPYPENGRVSPPTGIDPFDFAGWLMVCVVGGFGFRWVGIGSFSECDGWGIGIFGLKKVRFGNFAFVESFECCLLNKILVGVSFRVWKSFVKSVRFWKILVIWIWIVWFSYFCKLKDEYEGNGFIMYFSMGSNTNVWRFFFEIMCETHYG